MKMAQAILFAVIKTTHEGKGNGSLLCVLVSMVGTLASMYSLTPTLCPSHRYAKIAYDVLIMKGGGGIILSFVMKK
jgi:hypothetical protein